MEHQQRDRSARELGARTILEQRMDPRLRGLELGEHADSTRDDWDAFHADSPEPLPRRPIASERGKRRWPGFAA